MIKFCVTDGNFVVNKLRKAAMVDFSGGFWHCSAVGKCLPFLPFSWTVIFITVKSELTLQCPPNVIHQFYYVKFADGRSAV